MNKNYYAILGVAEDASKEEIRQAYKRLAFQYHPDRHADDHLFKEINEAQQVLLNDWKRMEYDSLLRENKKNVFSSLYLAGKRSNYKIMSRKLQTPLLILLLVAMIGGIIYYAVSSEMSAADEREADIAKANAESAGTTGYASSGYGTDGGNKTASSNSENGGSSSGKENIATSTTTPEVKKAEPAPVKTDVAAPVKKETPAPAKPAPATVTQTTQVNQTTTAARPAPVKTSPAPAAKTTVVAATPVQQPKQQSKNATSYPAKSNNATYGVKTAVNKPVATTSTVTAKAATPRTYAAKTSHATTANYSSAKPKTLSENELNDVLDKIYEAASANGYRCVQIQKMTSSNVTNAFDMVNALQGKGFVIAGRLTVPGNANGIKVEPVDGCVKVIVGTKK